MLIVDLETVAEGERVGWKGMSGVQVLEHT